MKNIFHLHSRKFLKIPSSITGWTVLTRRDSEMKNRDVGDTRSDANSNHVNTTKGAEAFDIQTVKFALIWLTSEKFPSF